MAVNLHDDLLPNFTVAKPSLQIHFFFIKVFRKYISLSLTCLSFEIYLTILDIKLLLLFQQKSPFYFIKSSKYIYTFDLRNKYIMLNIKNRYLYLIMSVSYLSYLHKILLTIIYRHSLFSIVRFSLWIYYISFTYVNTLRVQPPS